MEELPTTYQASPYEPSTIETSTLYSSLQHGHIRLLQILYTSDSPDTENGYRLESHPLSAKTEYVALSYAWGSPSEHVIQVNGIRFNVRKNLWRFLLHARTLKVRDPLWIDALCINQANNPERTSQVRLMPQIYRTARKVLVWLGPAHSGSNDALKELVRHSQWSTKKSKIITALGTPAGIAIQQLYSRRYWRRLWVVQEILLARIAEVMCGSMVIPMESLRTFLLAVKDLAPSTRLLEKETYLSIKQSSAILIMQYLAAQILPTRPNEKNMMGKRTLWNLMLATRHLSCAEPRDKVYALLGVAIEGHDDINPDYTTPIPTLLNKVLKNHHKVFNPKTTQEVEEQCNQLADFLSIDPELMFDMDGQQGHLEIDAQDIPPEWKKNKVSLLWSSFYGHTAVSNLLLDQGIVSLESARSIAASGNAAAMQLLLDIGRTRFDWVPLFYSAIRRNRVAIVKLLLDSGLVSASTEFMDGKALHVASLEGHHEVVKLLIDGGADVNAEGGKYGDPLQSALFRGRKAVVKLLLDAGADVNAPGGYFGSALQAALHRDVYPNQYNHVDELKKTTPEVMEMVKVLLDRGADVNMQGGFYGNALQTAAYQGRREAVELLLTAGADVNVQGGYFGNALQAAPVGDICYTRHDSNNVLSKSSAEAVDLVKLLLDAGADVNARGGHFGNALQAASYQGQYKAMRQLLDAGADVNSQGGYYGNALQAAAFGEIYSDRIFEDGNTVVNTLTKRPSKVVKLLTLLLDAGANVNATGGYYGTALQAACASRSDRNLPKADNSVVTLLLKAGANVNEQGGYFGNALYAACASPVDESLVKLLLDSGAWVNAEGGQCGYALQVASYRDKPDLVALLLERGADINAEGGYYGTALQAACVAPVGQKLVRMLLVAGANANAQGGYYGNALQAAAASFKNDREVLKILLDAGAVVNAHGGYYSNALQAALFLGNDDFVMMLLDAGADVNAHSEHYGNALQAACASKIDQEVILQLLQAGVDVNAQGGYYGNALQATAATRKGDWGTLNLLLDWGANVNAQGGHFGNALQAAASYYGQDDVIRILLDWGADVNAQGGYYGNALQAAAFKTRQVVVELLLNAGADVNAQGGCLGNALNAALTRDHQEIAKFLESRGASRIEPGQDEVRLGDASGDNSNPAKISDVDTRPLLS